MDPLDVPARSVLFHMEVQPNERERDLDWLGALIRMLSCEGIDDMLMNERRITMREGVRAQFVVGVLL